MKTKAVQAADAAADDALRAATLSKQFADDAARDRQRVEELTPDPHREMLQAFASQEQKALLRVGPRRNRWRDLEAFETQLVEIEQRRAALQRQLSELEEQLRAAPDRHVARLAAWMESGNGARPSSEAPALEHRIADARAEFDALGFQYDKVLADRAKHVAKNRNRFIRDVRKEVGKVATRQRRLIDELEANRQELLDLRRTQVWAGVFPNEAITTEPSTGALAGAVKRVQKPLLPSVEADLPAHAVFQLLRIDVDYCTQVATVEQQAAERGMTVAEFTNSQAAWQDGEPDLVGPSFPAVWGGSDEEKAQAKRQREYTRQLHRRLWGEEPAWERDT